METVLDLRLAGGGDRGFGMAAGSGDRRVWDRWKLGFFVDFGAPQQLISNSCLGFFVERERERLCFGFLGF